MERRVLREHRVRVVNRGDKVVEEGAVLVGIVQDELEDLLVAGYPECAEEDEQRDGFAYVGTNREAGIC